MHQDRDSFDKSRLLEAQRRLDAEKSSYAKDYYVKENPLNSLTNVLDRFMTSKGLLRMMSSGEIARVWHAALGNDKAAMTSLGAVRKGVLNVIVGNSSLLQELKLFRKVELLNRIRSCPAGSGVHDIRFRLGKVPNSNLPVAEISGPASTSPTMIPKVPNGNDAV